jgi:hypothetical protein
MSEAHLACVIAPRITKCVDVSVDGPNRMGARNDAMLLLVGVPIFASLLPADWELLA